MEAEFAAKQLISIRSCEPAKVGKDLGVISPYLKKLFSNWRVNFSSKECKLLSVISFVMEAR
jgi:hypothetical protein